MPAVQNVYSSPCQYLQGKQILKPSWYIQWLINTSSLRFKGTEKEGLQDGGHLRLFGQRPEGNAILHGGIPRRLDGCSLGIPDIRVSALHPSLEMLTVTNIWLLFCSTIQRSGCQVRRSLSSNYDCGQEKRTNHNKGRQIRRLPLRFFLRRSMDATLIWAPTTKFYHWSHIPEPACCYDLMMFTSQNCLFVFKSSIQSVTA